MPAKRLTTIMLTATALTGLAAPAAQAAQPSVDYRPACTKPRPCQWMCARHPDRVCPQYRPGPGAPDAMATRGYRTSRPAKLFAMPLVITPGNGCTTAVDAAAPC